MDKKKIAALRALQMAHTSASPEIVAAQSANVVSFYTTVLAREDEEADR